MKESEDRIETTVRQVLLRRVKGNVDPEKIGLETPLLGIELGLDSLDLFEVVVSLEKELDLSLEESELSIEVFRNIGTLVNHIREKCFPK